MLISRTWLQQLLLDPRGEDLPPAEQLDAIITSVGLEVEGITTYGDGLESIVVGEVLSIEPHPKADRLRTVTVGAGGDPITVVCGAPNVPEPGGKIAFAPVGTTLPGGLTLTAREVRGVPSHGMICSEQELDIGPDHEGILVLPSSWIAGERLVDRVPGIVDTVFELSVTPNRPDALGHVGVARDLAAKLGRMLAVPPLQDPRVHQIEDLVTQQAPEHCGRYFGYAFEDVKVGPSPLWLRVRLHRVGLRPINNVVDITNMVLMEWGQPLHAFDRAVLAEGRVVIRPAQPGESIATLDDQTLELRPEDLVIADASVPQALAGVMGGKTSGVLPGCTSLLLEAAWFAPRGVRRTAKHHQLGTDSSYRFERGVDHGLGLFRAAARAFGMLEELAGARCVGGLRVDGQRPPIPEITLRPDRIRMVLGMEISDAQARKILRGLEIEVEVTDPARWVCHPPTHRPDLQREVDLIEEVMRIHGLDQLPAVACMPTAYGESAATGLRAPAGALLRQQLDLLVDALAAQGLHEMVGLCFTDPARLARVMGTDVEPRLVHVDNPMPGQGPVLRTHLLPGLLDAAALNLARHGRATRLFEVGRVYGWGEPVAGDGPTAAIDRELPDEPMRAAVVLVAPRGQTNTSPVDGRAMAGILLDVLRTIGLQGTLAPTADDRPLLPYLHPGKQGHVLVDGVAVGHFGAIHPDVADIWDLPEDLPVVYGELSVDVLPAPSAVRFAALPRFPATSRDLSLDLDATIPASEVLRSLADAAVAVASSGDDPPRLAPGDDGQEAIEVVEDYRGKGVEPGRRALLLRLGYRAGDRSVTDAEVQALHDDLVNKALAALRTRDPSAQPR